MTALVAALVDRWFGEPPAALHPVVAMGRWLSVTGRWVRRPHRRDAQLAAGAVAWLAGVILVTVVARAAEAGSRRLSWGLAVAVRGVALSTLWSWRLLDREVAAVEQALSAADRTAEKSLADAREVASRLVSREVEGLDASGVRQAALESLAENLSDSVVAPCWWYAVGGLPAAAAYRWANTADAMWGYRDGWEWAGKVAARADDLANVVPARVTACLLTWLPAPVAGPRTLRPIPAEAGRTPSINAGWPMAALAVRLGVRLEKRGAYVLHAAGRPPIAADTRTARTLVRRAGMLAFASTALATLPRDLRGHGGRP